MITPKAPINDSLIKFPYFEAVNLSTDFHCLPDLCSPDVDVSFMISLFILSAAGGSLTSICLQMDVMTTEYYRLFNLNKDAPQLANTLISYHQLNRA
jgi:hypothetical protein